MSYRNLGMRAEYSGMGCVTGTPYRMEREGVHKMKRRVIRPDARLVQEFVFTQQQLPTHRPCILYIRQSTQRQLKRNKQSYELQDSDMRRLVQGYGWG